LRGEGIVRLAGTQVGLSGCRLRGPKAFHLGNGLLLLALRHQVSLPASTPLQIVNRCWPWFPCKWLYIKVETFNLFWVQNGNKVDERKSDSVTAARPVGKFNSNVTSLHAAVMTSNGARVHSEICVTPTGMYVYLESVTCTDTFQGDFKKLSEEE